MSQITLQTVRKIYDGKNSSAPAVVGLDLQIRDGEFITLVGPSGCGKTTTLRMIAGLESVTSGKVLIDGTDVTATPVQKRSLSMVFQNYAIFPHMTVAANIGYGLRVARVPKAERQQRVAVAAKLVGIEDFLDRLPKQLSGGQRQRVALARAIVSEQGTILMDEPLSNLDAKLRDQTRAEIKQLHRQLGNTMIYVTHDQLEALTMSDRIAVMNHGELQQLGTPQDIFDQPANVFVATFMGSPTMNILTARVEATSDAAAAVLADELRIPLTPTVLSLGLDGPVRVGIRPQHIEVSAETGELWRVQVVEPVGTESFIHLSRGPHEIVAVFRGRLTFGEGDDVRVAFPVEHLHVFDEPSGRALSHGASLVAERSLEPV